MISQCYCHRLGYFGARAFRGHVRPTMYHASQSIRRGGDNMPPNLSLNPDASPAGRLAWFVRPLAGVHMKVVAISVGRPREGRGRGRSVRTSIFKTPVSHRVHVTSGNVEGDEQSDLSVHGGPEKAVYAYPAEHYDFWRRELQDAELAWGAFGENFTTEGLLEGEVWIGDRYRVGTVELVVTQPRMPCYKLAIRFGQIEMVKRFLQSRRSGFYLASRHENGTSHHRRPARLMRRRTQRLRISGCHRSNQSGLSQSARGGHPGDLHPA